MFRKLLLVPSVLLIIITLCISCAPVISQKEVNELNSRVDSLSTSLQWTQKKLLTAEDSANSANTRITQLQEKLNQISADISDTNEFVACPTYTTQSPMLMPYYQQNYGYLYGYQYPWSYPYPYIPPIPAPTPPVTLTVNITASATAEGIGTATTTAEITVDRPTTIYVDAIATTEYVEATITADPPLPGTTLAEAQSGSQAAPLTADSAQQTQPEVTQTVAAAVTPATASPATTEIATTVAEKPSTPLPASTPVLTQAPDPVAIVTPTATVAAAATPATATPAITEIATTVAEKPSTPLPASTPVLTQAPELAFAIVTQTAVKKPVTSLTTVQSPNSSQTSSVSPQAAITIAKAALKPESSVSNTTNQLSSEAEPAATVKLATTQTTTVSGQATERSASVSGPVIASSQLAPLPAPTVTPVAQATEPASVTGSPVIAAPSTPERQTIKASTTGNAANTQVVIEKLDAKLTRTPVLSPPISNTSIPAPAVEPTSLTAVVSQSADTSARTPVSASTQPVVVPVAVTELVTIKSAQVSQYSIPVTTTIACPVNSVASPPAVIKPAEPTCTASIPTADVIKVSAPAKEFSPAIASTALISVPPAQANSQPAPEVVPTAHKSRTNVPLPSVSANNLEKPGIAERHVINNLATNPVAPANLSPSSNSVTAAYPASPAAPASANTYSTSIAPKRDPATTQQDRIPRVKAPPVPHNSVSNTSTAATSASSPATAQAIKPSPAIAAHIVTAPAPPARQSGSNITNRIKK